MKRTQLYEIHESLGATFYEYQGWEIVDKFSDPVEEHSAVRHSAGIIDLSYKGKLEFTGKDRASFLHGQISNEVKQLPVGSGNYATLLNRNGKILADMKVYVLPESILLEVDCGLCEKVSNTLNKYLIIEDVVIEDVTEQFGILSVQGPGSPRLMNAVVRNEVSDLKEFQHEENEIDGIPVRIFRTSCTGETGYDIYVPTGLMKAVWSTIFKKGREFGLKPVGMSTLNMLRIEAGIPWYGIDMDETNIPLEAVPDAVSWTKGCYLGQEIMVRIRDLGSVSKKLVGLIISGDKVPNIGDGIINNGNIAGNITSSVRSPSSNGVIAMGYVKKGLFDPGTKLSVESKGENLQAKVVELPFYSRTN